MADTTIKTGMTNIGLNIVAQSQLGATIQFTKVKIGDGVITTQDPAELTDLIHATNTLGILDGAILNNSTVRIGAVIPQAATGYYFREIGLFAINPATGQEVLYAYGNKGSNASYIPASGSGLVVEESATMLVKIADADNVIINYTHELGANRDLSNLSDVGQAKMDYLFEKAGYILGIDGGKANNSDNRELIDGGSAGNSDTLDVIDGGNAETPCSLVKEDFENIEKLGAVYEHINTKIPEHDTEISNINDNLDTLNTKNDYFDILSGGNGVNSDSLDTFDGGSANNTDDRDVIDGGNASNRSVVSDDEMEVLSNILVLKESADFATKKNIEQDARLDAIDTNLQDLNRTSGAYEIVSGGNGLNSDELDGIDGGNAENPDDLDVLDGGNASNIKNIITDDDIDNICELGVLKEKVSLLENSLTETKAALQALTDGTQTKFTALLSTLAVVFAAGGLYRNFNYDAATGNWYMEFYKDENHLERMFLLQGGYTAITNGYGIVNLDIEFKNKKYNVIATESYKTAVQTSFKMADMVATDSYTNSSFRLIGSTNADGAISTGASWLAFGI